MGCWWGSTCSCRILSAQYFREEGPVTHNFETRETLELSDESNCAKYGKHREEDRGCTAYGPHGDHHSMVNYSGSAQDVVRKKRLLVVTSPLSLARVHETF